VVDLVGEVMDKGLQGSPFLRPAQVFESMWQFNRMLEEPMP